MKRFAILIFIILLGYEGLSQTYNNRIKFEDLRKNKIFKLSPFHFFDRSLNVQGEFFVSPTYKNSLLIGLTGMYRDTKNRTDKGISLEVQGRYYPRAFSADTMPFIRNKAGGFYLAYGAQFGVNENKEISGLWDINGVYSSNDLKTKSAWVTPFFCFGYQVVAWETLYVDIYLGGGMKINNVSYSPDIQKNSNFIEEDPSIFDRAYKGIIPKLGFSVGIGI
jgi:hypothetical protein